MKALEIKELILECDEKGCGWEQKTTMEEVPRWHHQACPRCFKGEIMTNYDMLSFRVVSTFCKIFGFIEVKDNSEIFNFTFGTSSKKPKKP